MDVRDTEDLARLIRAARSRRGWSQQQTADAAGVSRRLVNQLEGGDHPNAELWRALAVVTALGISLTARIDDEATTVPMADDAGFDLNAHVDHFRTGPA